MLKPDEALPFAEQSRVRLTIEPIDAWTPKSGREAWESLKQMMREKPLYFGGKRYSRDELSR